MVKSDTKKLIKSAKAVKVKYDCDEVEKYLNKAIIRVKKEIMPRINAIDERDKMQYSSAKKIMMDANKIVISRQENVERTVTHMETELQGIYESRKLMVEQLTSSFDKLNNRFEDLHIKLDAHLLDEAKEFQSIRDGLTKAAGHVEAIQQTLDNVSANGKRGLSESLSDVFEKIVDLEKVTQGARMRAKFWTVMHDMIVSTPFLKPLKHKWGVIIYAALFLLIVNTIVHALGVQWDLLGLFKWTLSLINKQG